MALRQSGLGREDVWVTSKVGFFPPGSEGVWMYSGDNVKGQTTVSSSPVPIPIRPTLPEFQHYGPCAQSHHSTAIPNMACAFLILIL